MNFPSLVGHLLELLELVDTASLPADAVAGEFYRQRRYLGSHDRRYITNALFTILRHRRYLEELLDGFMRATPDAASSGLAEPRARSLALFVISMAAVDAVPEVEIFQSAGSRWRMATPNLDLERLLAWIRENSDLHFVTGSAAHVLAIRHSFPDWVVERWERHYTDRLETLLAALNKPASTVIRVNALKCTREECAARLLAEGIESTPTQTSSSGLVLGKRFNKNASNVFKEGWFEIQDEGSQLVSLMLPLKPGQFIIDACAGAGGKTLHLAERMGGEGEIIAVDVDPRRLEELEKRAFRAGVRNVRTSLRERFPREEFAGRADIVLVDAPCSGSGTIRRNPGMKWSITESLVRHFSELQSGILAENASYVKPGGALVYVTCSLFREENEDVVESFLNRNTDFAPVTPELGGFHLDPDPNSTVHLMPDKIDTDGFFVAVMRKR